MANIPFGDYYYISLDDYNTLTSYFGTNYGGLEGYVVEQGSGQTPAGYYILPDQIDTEEEEDQLFALPSFDFHPVFESVQGVYCPFLP